MAFDKHLLRGDPNAAIPQGGDDAREASWTLTRERTEVEDSSTGRTLRFLSSAPSVMLWDEVTPTPRALRDEADDDRDD